MFNKVLFIIATTLLAVFVFTSTAQAINQEYGGEGFKASIEVLLHKPVPAFRNNLENLIGNDNFKVTGRHGVKACLAKQGTGSSEFGACVSTWGFTANFDGSPAKLKVDVVSVTANFRGYGDFGKIRPFAGVGLGIAATEAKVGSAKENETTGSWLLEAGSDFYVFKNFALTGSLNIGGPFKKFEGDLSVLAVTFGLGAKLHF